MSARVLLVILCSLAVSAYAGDGPVAGDAAPHFRLQDQNGNWHELEDYCGEWLALYFYPKDDTPGCTTEACAFRDDHVKYRKLGVKLLGVSVDDVDSHKEFAEKYHLPFPLLADTEKKTAEAYGVLKNYVVTKLASRQTFLIDPNQTVAKRYTKVDPESHSAEVLADLRALQSKMP